MAVDSSKPLSIALEEIAAEKVVAVEPSDDDVVDPLSFIDMDDDETVTALSLIPGEGLDDAADSGDVEPA
jgi:hypothetical protein